MVKKKYQVFVSSTFEDLREERQSAVEAILKAGHIPAGMELFTAGSQSQMNVIRQWIRDSDIYMLILGARYGSIEEASGLSYTELEFNYAREIGKPFFSVLLTAEGRAAKVAAHGEKVLELKHPDRYKQFETIVKSQLCAFFAEPKDVKLAVFETLPQLISDADLSGWVPASEVAPSVGLTAELTAVLEENRKLKSQIAGLEKAMATYKSADDSFINLCLVLKNQKVTVPANISRGGKSFESNVLQLAIDYSSSLAAGVSNSTRVSEFEGFLMYNVASPLAAVGLAEADKVPSSVMWKRLKLSKAGVSFIKEAQIRIAAEGAIVPKSESREKVPVKTKKAGTA